MISALGRGQLWPKNYTLEVGADQQKIFCYWTKYAIFGVSFIVYQVSPQVASKPHGVIPPSLVSCYSAFIVDEISVICLLIC